MRPLDRIGSIKVKLGVVIVATVGGTVAVLALGRRAGLDLEWRVLLAAALGLAMVQFLARGMTSPLRDMASAASAMARGDYDRRVTATSRDEVGELARAFNTMATELGEVDRMRRELVANVSHELRTPVASLKALAETLEGGALEDPPAARLFLTRMLLETDRLAQLVEELLELALLESGAAKLEREPFDVAEIIPRATERLHAHAYQHGVDLIVQACPTPALIIGDALRLERVLINLVDNAVKFTAPGGRVIIACDVRNDQVVVSVNDTGAGIPAQDVGRVFERFYKADRARASAGTGLGLAIAKHTVEAHNGRIWVESVEGAGSTFSFSIPEAPPPPAVPAGQVRARSNGR
jgi:signal transduction histidine kinase